MSRTLAMLWWLLWAAVAVKGLEVELTQDRMQAQQCSGMYSKRAWGGPTEPYIQAKFQNYKPREDKPNADTTLAFLIFEWGDRSQIGVRVEDGENGPERMEYICDTSAIQAKLCNEDHYGEFILAENATDRIFTQAVDMAEDKKPVPSYRITKTGYYCVTTQGVDPELEYSAIVTFRNAYGELPGAQIAKLPFYGGLTIAYAVIGVFWAFLYVQNRHDILPVQNYITATIIFLAVEMLATWGYYDYMNRHGSNAMAKFLMMLVSILNAGRNSFSFYLLLIVCMGYGVVRSNLGRRMLWARILGVTHFFFGVVYAIGSLTIAPEDAGPLVLLVVMPLAATLTIFYIWTLNSLAATLKDLVDRKQRVKAAMYRKLWWLILGSVLVIFGFFFLNSFTFANVSDADFTPAHWRTRWFVLDGWLNLVYLVDVAVIAYLWRPTANNRRFAMSEEISQDDEGFEIASVRDSLDGLGDDEESGDDAEARHAVQSSSQAGIGSYPQLKSDDAAPPPYAGADGGREALLSDVKNARPMDPRDQSPLPAPKPQRPIDRRSLEQGETIFAVDDEDEESGDEDERQGLTGIGKRE